MHTKGSDQRQIEVNARIGPFARKLGLKDWTLDWKERQEMSGSMG